MFRRRSWYHCHVLASDGVFPGSSPGWARRPAEYQVVVRPLFLYVAALRDGYTYLDVVSSPRRLDVALSELRLEVSDVDALSSAIGPALNRALANLTR